MPRKVELTFYTLEEKKPKNFSCVLLRTTKAGIDFGWPTGRGTWSGSDWERDLPDSDIREWAEIPGDES